MLGRIVALLLLVELGQGQEVGTDAVRRLRFRRPRPKLIDVENPDGDLVGRPVELIQPVQSDLQAEDLITAAQNSRPQTFPSRHSGSAALDALIATAQREDLSPAQDPSLPAPQLLLIEEVPTQRPFTQVVETARPRDKRPRTRGGIPRGGGGAGRSRAKQQPEPEGDQPLRGGGPNAGGRERQRPGERDEPVGTLERYNHKNEDGSFTFGYVGADGSFREETRGADCITRGKYGYIDPDGVKREYSYTSGLKCDENEGEGSLQDLDENQNVKDTVDPRERFRQTQEEQLNGNQIPKERQKQIANRQRLPIRQSQNSQRQPQTSSVPERQSQDSFFPQSQSVPARQPTTTPQANTFANFGSQDSSALQNLLTIADPAPAPQRPALTRAPVRISQRPAQTRPVQTQPAQSLGSFDFDSELEGFTLNRPAIKFEQSSIPAVSPPSSQFSLNQNNGIFQTSPQKSLPGREQIRTNNNAQPSSFVTTQPPPTTRVINLATSHPQKVVPAGTVVIRPTFKPLTIPKDIGQAVPVPRAPPATPAPRPALPAREAPRNPQAPTQAAPNSNGFFVFQPFNQKPASAPFRTPVNPNAFQIQPQPQPKATPQPQGPPQLLSQGGRPLSVPQSQLPPGVFAVPAGQSIPPGAVRVNAQGAPLQEQPRFSAPAPNAPQLQFGFQPVSQPAPQPQRAPQGVLTPFQQIQAQSNRAPQGQPQTFQQIQSQPQRAPQGGPTPFQQIQSQSQRAPQGLPQGVPQRAPQRAPQGLPQGNRPAPFTAFSAGVPPQQLRASGQGPQLGVPPQLQRPGPGQFAQFDSRFGPRPQSPGQLRPAQFQQGGQGQGFGVFSPSQLRGA